MKKVLNKILSINILPFEVEIDKQKNILNQFDEPKDLIERSYFQFAAQFYFANSQKRILNNLIGFFAIFYFFIKGAMSNTTLTKKKSKKNTIIYPYKNYHYPNIIPSEISEEYEIVDVNYMSGYLFSIKDLSIIFILIKRYPLKFYFLSKCISKLLFYRFLIEKYNPNAILSSAEYSFSSSYLTYFCRKNSILHINVMHGEKFFIIKDSFFEFDKFYIWDEFYKNLFIKLRASPNQFIIGNFKNLKMSLKLNVIKYNYTYYLAAEKGKTLEAIKNTLIRLDDPKKICIRYHPRYSSYEEIKNVFKNFNIEDPTIVSMEESFSYTNHVISLYSTCLNQAYYNNKKIIIDDVNHDSEKIKTLKDSDYIIFSKPHYLLSQLIK